MDDEWWTLAAVCDGTGTFPEPLEAAFPGSGLRGPWRLHVHCYVVWSAGHTIVIDTGIGPRWSPAASWFERPGRLLDGLAVLDVEPADVTDVVLTHVHADHVGGAVHGDADDPQPTFPNARHLVQRAELEHLGERPPFPTHIRPLRDAGLLAVEDGMHEFAPGPRSRAVYRRLGSMGMQWPPTRRDVGADRFARRDNDLSGVDGVGMLAAPTPGHTPGHQSVIAVGADNAYVYVSGDVFVHPAQVRDPDVRYRHDADPVEAAESRRKVLHFLDEFSMRFAPAHFDVAILRTTNTPAGRVLDPVVSCPDGAGSGG